MITNKQGANNARNFDGYSEFFHNEDIVDKYSYPEMTPIRDIPDDVRDILNEQFEATERRFE